MASTVVIREYSDLKEDRVGHASILTRGPLATDDLGLPIKTILAGPGAADATPLTSRTRFLIIENKGINTIRYCIRPKNASGPFPATALHSPVLAGSMVSESAYPGAVISFIEAP